MIDLSKKYDHFARRLRDAMEDRNLTNEEMSERVESHPVTISKLRRGHLRIDDEWRAILAKGLDIEEEVLFGTGPLPKPSVEEIFTPAKRRGRKAANNNHLLPIFGLAAGSIIGHQVMTTEVVEYIPCPPGLANVLGAYALRTNGESMIPRYFPKDILYINPTQNPVAGDHVIIQVQRYESASLETWVKRFERATDAEILVSQYNPVAQMAFKKELVRGVHRVLPVNELFPSP